MTIETNGTEVKTTEVLNSAQVKRQYTPSFPRWGKWYSPDVDATGTATTTANLTDTSATNAETTTSSGTQTGANNSNSANAGIGTGKTSIKDLPQDVQVYIEELRDEAKKHRLEKQKAERDAKEAEEARLAQQNEWKILAEKRAQRIVELEPVELQYREIQEAFNSALETKLKGIAEDVRKQKVDPVRATMTPVQFSKWLDAILPDLQTKPAPDLDAGAGGSATGKRRLDPKKDIPKVSY